MKRVFVVLNYNDFERTSKFINDVKDYNSIDHIIVVDNNSTDDSFKLLKNIKLDKLTVLKSDINKGYGAGNNIGCKYANKKFDNPIIFISNPDVLVENNTIKVLADTLENDDIMGAISCNIYQDGGVERGWKLLSPFKSSILTFPFVYKMLKSKNNSNYFYSDTHYLDEYSYVEVVTGCFFAIKGDVMKKIDYFDENLFLYNEEEVIATKLKNFGYKTGVYNSLSVIHEHSVSISKNFSSINKIKISNRSKNYYQRNYNNANFFEMILIHISNFNSILKEYVRVIINKIFK